MSIRNLVGEKFGRLKVINFVEVTKDYEVIWNCLCDCGGTINVPRRRLISGNTKSCGCIRIEKPNGTTHGYSDKIPEYKSWQDMKARCNNKNNKEYHNYGAIGRKVCIGWVNSFQTFLSDVGFNPIPILTLDRIDNDANYSCGHCIECVENGWVLNCRWGTSEQQSRNKRTNIWIEHNGVKMIRGDWAKRFGISDSRLKNYLRKRTMSEIENMFNDEQPKK